ncbi:thermonuclease family protein [Bacillus thuringiensis]|nr:thermonuclease family protein [Bacillus thuringiensis]MED3352954.1 thermonuclease family protein [Bacillus thuringiensis]OTW86285.1 hypothetical protein BK710_14575 [Bacillus thuringiensis serovar sumiyoshiensis]OTW90766.1 hypothetical protein BK711_30225 [Bacillus thuringiensis serovar fukuokaensis]
MNPVPGESKKQNAIRIIKATILDHFDGDTFRVKLANGKVEVVRFLCIDTPEVHHPRLGLQPFGLEEAFTAKYAPVGKEVALEMNVGERDNFKRLVAYVWADGQLLNRMLVKRGLARVAYTYQPYTKYVDYLEKTQKKAQKLCERIGMRKEVHFIQDFWSKNEWTDSIVYGMLSSDLK